MSDEFDAGVNHVVLNLSREEAESVWTHLDGILVGAGDTISDSENLESAIEKIKRQL